MRKFRSSASLTFWILWVLATALGSGLGFIAALFVSGSVGLDLTPIVLFFVMYGFVGWVQWLVLQTRLRQVGGWMMLTALGWGLGWELGLRYVGKQAGRHVNEFVALLIGSAIIGVCAGFAQWLVLRRRVRRAGWWILSTIISVVVSRGVAEYVIQGGDHLEVILYMTLMGALVGMTTGIPMVWLLRRPKRRWGMTG